MSTLPVLPKTCGACDHFERWNDGYCNLDERVAAERLEPPPHACPLRGNDELRNRAELRSLYLAWWAARYPGTPLRDAADVERRKKAVETTEKALTEAYERLVSERERALVTAGADACCGCCALRPDAVSWCCATFGERPDLSDLRP